MRTGIFLSYAGGFREAVEDVIELEKIGVDIALVPEAYSYDAISQLGYLAAKTSRIELGSGVVPIYVRTPSLLAMTAAGLDYVSDGRFRLGIGTSGPQVMEGFHGVPFDAPLGRTREVVDLQAGVAPRAGEIRRQVLSDSAARRPGHRPWQAAAADQSPCPRTHSDHHRGAGRQERRTRRRDRRRLAAGVLPPGESRRRLGRLAAGGVRQARPKAGSAGHHGQRRPGDRR
jgi:alkanesulfonate monooxygenase SsuD/methylene tetrahydromethanopterin reductase-like flavin-dependent oxidoreductase (luciferase family)